MILFPSAVYLTKMILFTGTTSDSHRTFQSHTETRLDGNV